MTNLLFEPPFGGLRGNVRYDCLLMMSCSKTCQPCIMSVCPCYEFFWGRLDVEFLCKFCRSFGSDLSVGSHRPYEMEVGVSHFIHNETGLRALTEMTHCFVGTHIKNSTTDDRAHNRQLLSSQYLPDSMNYRYFNKKWINLDVFATAAVVK